MFLSVVIPACNAASSIRRTLDCLCKWHGDDIEIIVIDDGSPDDTAVVVRRSYANDSRVRLLSQDDCGRSVLAVWALATQAANGLCLQTRMTIICLVGIKPFAAACWGKGLTASCSFSP